MSKTTGINDGDLRPCSTRGCKRDAERPNRMCYTCQQKLRKIHRNANYHGMSKEN